MVKNPQVGKSSGEIKSDLRSFVKASYTVCYRIDDEFIRIVRVLYDRRGIPRWVD